jgi:hypothetical protein
MLSVISVQTRSQIRLLVFAHGVVAYPCVAVELDEAMYVLAAMRLVHGWFVICWTERTRRDSSQVMWARARVGVFSFRVHVTEMLPLRIWMLRFVIYTH